MDSKDHAPSPWRRLSKQKKVLLISCLIITMVLIWIQWQTPTDTNADTNADTNETIPSNTCDWRPEPLQGTCDVTKATIDSQLYKTGIECENACCDNKDCISFQFRAKEGCLWGGDTRLGAEKDGVPSWCEPRPPSKWHGQYIKKDGDIVNDVCDNRWNPKELQGQCFGLGTKRDIVSNTPESCRDACCAENTKDGSVGCAIWQWRNDAGCFYHKNAHNCQDANPLDFEKFIGKRKIVEGRTYTPHAYSHDFADMANVS